jgi:cell division protein FtsZ
VIDDTLGDEVRVTVIAAGFDRWDAPRQPLSTSTTASGGLGLGDDLDDDIDLDPDDDFDVPSFLR